MRFWRSLELTNLRPPELLYFDHLYSQYLSMKAQFPADQTAMIEGLREKVKVEDEEGRGKKKKDEQRMQDALSWDDLYLFELILAEKMPPEKLRSRIVRLRSDYRSIASEKEFAEYLGAKPPDLQSPPEPADPPDGTPAHYTELLREDLKDLLGRIYTKYALLPVREKRLTDLTLFAAQLCLYSLIALLVILLIVFVIPLIGDVATVWKEGGIRGAATAFMNSPNLSSLTIFVVVVCGAMGGFVSALQRIQSPPTEGDSIYNLSLLFYGSKSIFVAPISGAIFATLLYMMFAAGVLQGSFFPTIYTPTGKEVAETAPTPSGSPTPSPDNQEGAVPGTAANSASGLAASNSSNVPPGDSTPPSEPASASANATAAASPAIGTPTATASPSPKASATPTPTPATNGSESTKEATKGLNVFDFLARSGPASGRDYALLIIWCFIAGFAERLVPDALDRLISNGKSGSK